MLLPTCASEQGNWASKASPTLGYSIEISRDIVVGMSYVVCRMSVVCHLNCVGRITWPTRMLKVFFGAFKAVTPVIFISYSLEL